MTPVHDALDDECQEMPPEWWVEAEAEHLAQLKEEISADDFEPSLDERIELEKRARRIFAVGRHQHAPPRQRAQKARRTRRVQCRMRARPRRRSPRRQRRHQSTRARNGDPPPPPTRAVVSRRRCARKKTPFTGYKNLDAETAKGRIQIDSSGYAPRPRGVVRAQARSAPSSLKALDAESAASQPGPLRHKPSHPNGSNGPHATTRALDEFHRTVPRALIPGAPCRS